MVWCSNYNIIKSSTRSHAATHHAISIGHEEGQRHARLRLGGMLEGGER